jgi:hypothetical protein
MLQVAVRCNADQRLMESRGPCLDLEEPNTFFPDFGQMFVGS